ncbi:hypothetical protein LB565_08740 [Mesorhizobium sp. CA14]|uniref:hypothetical protein n=1 Tax=Mesorhizobium sp. CA14 TaxID=2876642 RepID=UPI001CCE3BFF|nr:hypothetical protein [Mesorhizobium sp. CA14]MBZ9848070.1 hypothetical protein [Mesorhizobium sp. CA14]
MSSNQIIERAIGSLANIMRMYVETHMRFGELFKVDPEEAIDNLDRTFEMKLEAFHTLYDVSKGLFPYFGHGDTTVLLAVRNAIHHRNHPLFHSLNRRLYLDTDLDRWCGASFLLARHPTLHGTPIQTSHCVRLDDLDARLDPSCASPYLDTTVGSDKAVRRMEGIDMQLKLPAIRDRGLRDRYPKDQIYLDLMPIFVSAVCKVFKAMKAAGVAFRGFDAETYAVPFTSEIEVDLSSPSLKRLRVGGLGPPVIVDV